MSKKGRAANKRRKAQARAEAVGLIADATAAVGTWFDDDAECVEGCSLLVAVLRSLGLEARVQPVHTLIFYSPEDQPEALVIATSQGAVDFAVAHELGNPEWEWDSLREEADRGWAGHAVVVVDEPGKVLDPTFGQFAKAGFPDRVIYINVADAQDPTGGFWAVEPAEFGGRFRVHYVPEDGDTEILEKAAILTSSWRQVGEDVARQLRAGGAPSVRWPMTWSQFKAIDQVRDFS